MDRDLIKKNKMAFDHWLNGGCVMLARKHTDGEYSYSPADTNWETTIGQSSGCDKIAYIIADEFIEYRKALFEGKTVEVRINGKWKEKMSQNYNDAFHSFVVYRVKQDTRQIKYGDWVRVYDPILGQRHCCVYTVECYAQANEDTTITLWTPERDEWCVFYNSLDDSEYVVAKYHHSYTIIGGLTSFVPQSASIMINSYDNIAPLAALEEIIRMKSTQGGQNA